ncbi:2OG-Fe(II) oxygenase family protein [Rhodobacteraceae bacterium]|nr:2OG-Fe(II) oxygenase family protein [Paracoccaceae bacterium]
MAVAPDAQFQRLWPTLFMSLVLPGSENANSVLTELLLQADDEAEDLTVRYLDQDIFQNPHPAVGWLRQCCVRAVLDYAVEAGLDYRPDFDVQAWVNINRRGDYHNLHNHPHAWLSGTYYVAMPEQPPAGHRTDLNPGAISFFDPRAQVNMTAVRGDGQFDPEIRRLPKAGELFLWPSFLHHFVHPNLSDSPRISISFNAVLRRKELS